MEFADWPGSVKLVMFYLSLIYFAETALIDCFTENNAARIVVANSQRSFSVVLMHFQVWYLCPRGRTPYPCIVRGKYFNIHTIGDKRHATIQYVHMIAIAWLLYSKFATSVALGRFLDCVGTMCIWWPSLRWLILVI